MGHLHSSVSYSWLVATVPVAACGALRSPGLVSSPGLWRCGAMLLSLALLIRAGAVARAEDRPQASKAPTAQAASATPLVSKGALPEEDKTGDLVSLEVDAKVTTKGVRRELDPEAAAKAAKVKRIERTASGIVVARGTNGMAFSDGFAGGGQEFWLPFEAGLKLAGYRSLSEIHDGDHVNVTYEEKEDDHELFLKRVALMRKTQAAGGSSPADAAPAAPAASSEGAAP